MRPPNHHCVQADVFCRHERPQPSPPLRHCLCVVCVCWGDRSLPHVGSSRFSREDSSGISSPDGDRRGGLRRERSAHFPVPTTGARTMAHLEEVIRDAEDTSKTTEWLQLHVEELVRACVRACV
jgi:hypothetical protein